LGDTSNPPQRSRASSVAMRRGPKPGWAIENETIRSSTTAESWFGICGRRRSLGRKTSRPWRSIRRVQA